MRRLDQHSSGVSTKYPAPSSDAARFPRYPVTPRLPCSNTTPIGCVDAAVAVACAPARNSKAAVATLPHFIKMTRGSPQPLQPAEDGVFRGVWRSQMLCTNRNETAQRVGRRLIERRVGTC